MTREEKLESIMTQLTESRRLVFLLKQMFIQNLGQLPDDQLDLFLEILSQYEAPST